MIIEIVNEELSLNDFDSIQLKISQDNDVIFFTYKDDEKMWYKSLPMNLEVINNLKTKIFNLINTVFDEINIFVCQDYSFNGDKTIIFTDDKSIYKEFEYPYFLEEISLILKFSSTTGKVYKTF